MMIKVKMSTRKYTERKRANSVRSWQRGLQQIIKPSEKNMSNLIFFYKNCLAGKSSLMR